LLAGPSTLVLLPFRQSRVLATQRNDGQASAVKAKGRFKNVFSFCPQGT
jgi:hypothetical protein